MREKKRISVFNQDPYDGEWPPIDLVGCIAWFSEKLASIPEEYRDTARIEIDSVDGNEDDSHYVNIDISYVRLETDDEISAREAVEQRRLEALKSEELQTLAELKAKYE